MNQFVKHAIPANFLDDLDSAIKALEDAIKVRELKDSYGNRVPAGQPGPSSGSTLKCMRGERSASGNSAPALFSFR